MYDKRWAKKRKCFLKTAKGEARTRDYNIYV